MACGPSSSIDWDCPDTEILPHTCTHIGVRGMKRAFHQCGEPLMHITMNYIDRLTTTAPPKELRLAIGDPPIGTFQDTAWALRH